MSDVDEWLFKAEHDLKSAELIFTHDKTLLDTVVYHTQQTVEKALKAVLVSNGVLPEKTHNVTKLLRLCCEYVPNLSVLSEFVFLVSPFDTLFRYPGEELTPDEETASEAIHAAKSVYHLVNTTLRNFSEQ